jgi:hypothetical protein
LRALRFFFLSPSAPPALLAFAVLLALLASDLAGAFEAVVDAGALLAVDTGYVE